MRNDLQVSEHSKMIISSWVIALLLSGVANSAPAIDLGAISGSDATPTNSAAQSTATVPYVSLEPNGPLWDSTFHGIPQPIRGSLGATLLGPTDDAIVKGNPDLVAPPSTDHGSVYVYITLSRLISK